jgi:autotransporter-associated beta strand protein
MGPFCPTGSSTYSGNATVNSGHLTATPFLPQQSSTWLSTSGLTKVGAGTLTLSGTNSYVGGSTVIPRTSNLPTAISTYDPNGYLTGVTITSAGSDITATPVNTLVSSSTPPSGWSSGSTITAVPEPSGLVLGGLAAAAFLLAGRIRRQHD